MVRDYTPLNPSAFGVTLYSPGKNRAYYEVHERPKLIKLERVVFVFMKRIE